MFADNHVHGRDFEEAHKETVRHVLEVARDSGVDFVGFQPNTKPSIIDEKSLLAMFGLIADAGVHEVAAGVYIGLTADAEQNKEAVGLARKYNSGFPRVVGLKEYTDSFGSLGIRKTEEQFRTIETLSKEGWDGMLMIHAEDVNAMKKDVWTPEIPISHCIARPKECEIVAVANYIKYVIDAGFKGKLHFAHLSVPESVDLVNMARRNGIDVSCEVMPHHLILDWTQMNAYNGILWKVNPALRSPDSPPKMVKKLMNGEIDFIATDHANHTLKEKLEAPYCSGLPGLRGWNFTTEFLRAHEFSEVQIERVTFYNALERLGIGDVERSRRKIVDRKADYAFNPLSPLEEHVNSS